jgi:hypothetical protein
MIFTNPDKPEPNKEPLMDANKREYRDDLIFKDEVFHILENY